MRYNKFIARNDQNVKSEDYNTLYSSPLVEGQ